MSRSGSVIEMLSKEINLCGDPSGLRAVGRTAPKVARESVEGDWAVVD